MTDAHIIIAGQSNALGYLNNGPAPYVNTARVQIWADTNGDGQGDAWNYMRPGPGGNTGTPANPNAWGPEVEIAKRWLADHPDPNDHLWIVKVAKGSTGLAQDPNQLDWSPNSRGEMFDTATATIDAARNDLNWSPTYSFGRWDAAMWMQGEQDATDPAKAAAYSASLTGFLAAARFQWDVTEFYAARITDSPALPDNFAVRVAQWDVDAADAHLETFKTIGLTMQPDQIHYADHIGLGDRFYDAWVF